ITGVPGVAFATSGPGATNLLTAIGSCYFDSTPAVFITGQVPTAELKSVRGVRQLGFQETDIASMARPVTKAAWAVTSPREVPGVLFSAFYRALDGRPGPVLIDIPLDVSRATLDDAPHIRRVTPAQSMFTWGREQTASGLLHDLFDGAKRPLVLIGGGCASPRVRPVVRQFLHGLDVPVVTSLMALDVPVKSVGFIGSYGNRWANWALQNCDALLVLGSRLDVRQTGADVGAFLSGKKILRVDVDEAELVDGRLPARAAQNVCCTVPAFIAASAGHVYDTGPVEWREQIAERRERWWHELAVPANTIHPNSFIRALGLFNSASDIFVLDVGAHQMWAAQSLRADTAFRVITSGGMGSMGWALPAAVGAAFAAPKQTIVVITGDGGLQVNIQELQTIAEHGLPIKIVVLNNGGHAMVRQFQDQYFEHRHTATRPRAPLFREIALAYGLADYGVAATPAHVWSGLGKMWRIPQEAGLLEVLIDPGVGIAPKMAFGKRLDEMDPPRE
ncbi:MAG: thiamine pyrophosphate-binding protein, partial [Chloroflexota bacterium]|nr:thiamine pyrophosphate-binding protein [Chloroflexota bacterium]